MVVCIFPDNGGRAAFGHFLLNAILGNEGRRSADFFQISYYAGQIGKSYEEAFWYYVNTGYHGISDDTVPGYYITYHAEGASGVPGRQRKADNINIVLSSAEPRRTGYTFQGWSTHENDSIIEYRPGQEYAGDAELHLYAVWKKNTYTIRYDVNEGDSSIRIPDQDKTHGEDLKLSSVEPVRVNYGFAGWATSRDAQTALYQPGAIYRQDQDATLYAVWKKDVYKVIYSANTDGADDSVTGLPESFEREAGEEIQISSAVPSREGYTFQGWGRIMEGGFVKEYKAGERFNENSTLILYASWKINTYPVTYYNADENGDYIPWRTQTKTYGEDLQLAESVPLKTGCDFKGWAVYASSSSVKYHAGDSYSENKKLDLYAVWEPKKYTVSYDANGGANAPASQTKKYGEALKLSSSSLYRQGYTFLGWSTRASDTVPEYQAGQEYSKEADLKLYAVWERLTYTIRYDANGGAFSDAPLPEEKEWGTDLVLTGKVPVRDGYEFLGWSESKSAATASYQPGGVFAKDRDTVLYAVWKEKQAQGSDNGNGGSSNGGNSNGGNSTGSNPQPDSMGQGNEGTVKTALSIQTGKSVYKVALGTKPFSLNAKEEHGSALSFQSSNPKVAKVSKDGKVTIKGCGVATITITAGTGSQAVKKTVQVQVTPKKQKIKARYNKGQRKLQVEWNKDSKASGYVVCISKSKKFAKKDTREYPYGKSVCGRIYSGLKKGTYYIRVRSYVKVGKKKYYGGWSSVKKVKVS